MATDPKDKAFSAPLPLRAIGDPRLAGVDLRTLACIAAHDHMSLKLGKGQGCHASHETLAAKIGCNYINLGKSIRKLEELGYLDCSRQPGRGKFHTYRVPSGLYDYEESLSFHQPSADAQTQASSRKVGQTTNDPDEKACHGVEENHAKTDTSLEQYISLSDERYSAEAGEKYSSEDARFAARDAQQDDYCANVGAELGKLERALKAHEIGADDLGLWLPWLEGVSAADYGDPINGWVNRLIEACDERLELISWEGATAAAQSA